MWKKILHSAQKFNIFPVDANTGPMTYIVKEPEIMLLKWDVFYDVVKLMFQRVKIQLDG